MCHIHLSLFTNLMQVGLGTLEVRFPKIWNRRALIFWRIWFFGIWLCCAMLNCSVVSDSLKPHGLQPARCLWTWRFSGQEYWDGLPWPPLGDLPNPGIKLRFPALQDGSSPSKPPEKPKNTGVDSQSLLQRIFWPRNRTEVSCIAGWFFISWATREAGEGNSTPLQYSCLENPMDGGAW